MIVFAVGVCVALHYCYCLGVIFELNLFFYMSRLLLTGCCCTLRREYCLCGGLVVIGDVAGENTCDCLVVQLLPLIGVLIVESLEGETLSWCPCEVAHGYANCCPCYFVSC